MTILLLPFAAYLIAPGAYIWSFHTLILVVLALLTTNEDKLCLSIGHTSLDHQEDCHGHGNENTTSYRRNILLIREETLCMVCYFGSTVYNKAAGGSYHGFKWIDSTLGLQKHGDVTPMNMYHLMGFASPINLPPFVSRAFGSTSASRVFARVWTVLPFLYVFNFVVVLAMSHRSPGKWIQRFLATFGMVHFLFFTDAVSYMYLRGYRNEHEVLFHWTEKWSWRIGIMLPLYKNCTNGHWGRQSHRCSILGVAQRYFAMAWGVLFFVIQTLQSDVIRTYGFLTGGDSSKGLIRLWGLDKKSSLMKKLDYPYFKALVWMWTMYAILHICCLRLNRVNLRRNSSDRKRLAF